MTSPGATSITVLSQGRAAVYEEPLGPAGVRVRTRPRTEPVSGAVAIAIRAASINHLDLFLAHGAQRVTPPRVIAADGAGVVQASGDPAWRPGDEVVIYPVVCDWTCEWCRSGQNVRCPHFGVIGEHSDGTACEDRKSTRLNSSHGYISYAVFCLKKKKHNTVHRSAVHEPITALPPPYEFNIASASSARVYIHNETMIPPRPASTYYMRST